MNVRQFGDDMGMHPRVRSAFNMAQDQVIEGNPNVAQLAMLTAILREVVEINDRLASHQNA